MTVTLNASRPLFSDHLRKLLQMRKYVSPILNTLAITLLTSSSVSAVEFDSRIPMRETGVATYLVNGEIAGAGPADFMVDTGAGYTTINETTLAMLQYNGGATYMREISGMLANGSMITVPVYRINQMTIGTSCVLRDVEAAVFPGNTRQILGLSALRQAAPFIFSVEPPQLVLSHCAAQVAQRVDEAM